MRSLLHWMLPRTLRWKLIAGVAIVHAVLMVLFVWDLTERQRELLLERQTDHAMALARNLATTSAGWVAARDLYGLQEIVAAQSQYPELNFAMIVDTERKILAHSEPRLVGLYVQDLPLVMELRLLSQTVDLIDVVNPIFVGGKHVGWVRIGLEQKATAERLADISRDGMLYALVAVLIGSLMAWWLGMRLTGRLNLMRRVAQDVQAGDLAQRVATEGDDEAVDLARALNTMLDELDASRHELEFNEKRWVRALDAAGLGVWDWNPNTDQVFFSVRWKSMLGYGEAEIGDTLDEWSSRVHPDDLDACNAALEQHFSGNSSYYQNEHRLRHKDGHWVWVLDQGMVFEWTSDHRPLRVVGTHMDITAMKCAHAELIEARRVAEDASVAKSRFLATMSHEIRTPMNGIMGMAQLLLGTKLRDAERQDYARTILESGQTLLSLINDILDLSKVEAGRLELELTAFDPAQVINEIQGQFFETAQRKGLRLEAVWHGQASRLYRGDPFRLKQMLANLVSNAIKFTDHGRVQIEGRECPQTEAPPGGGMPEVALEFSVTDTGIGISSEKQARLFQPFSQADSSTTRRYGGTGLGLSIVRSLAQLMQGDVGVDSEAGRGARFWFRVRAGRVVDEAQDRYAHRSFFSPMHALTERIRFDGRVLVIEDDEVNRKVIGALLSRFGVSVTLAEGGQQGLDAVLADRPDIVITDVQMPAMDGYMLTERIRANEAATGKPRLPIIALTADAFEDNRRRCLAAGMDEFLTKPVSVEALQVAIARWFKPRRVSSPAVVASTPRAVDRETVQTMVSELLDLLAQNKFDAVLRFDELCRFVEGSSLAPAIDAASKPLAEFRFEVASEMLRKVAKAQGWKTGFP